MVTMAGKNTTGIVSRLKGLFSSRGRADDYDRFFEEEEVKPKIVGQDEVNQRGFEEEPDQDDDGGDDGGDDD